MGDTDDVERKQRQFNAAMERYEDKSVYRWVERTVSVVNLSLQAYLLALALATPIAPLQRLAVFVLAFVLADLVGGLAHMIADNNDRYQGFIGPLVAAFHLHHKRPVYKRRNFFVVYFHESGSKIWLAILLLLVALAHALVGLPRFALHLAATFAVLSSVAELSHYLCHVPHRRIFDFLARAGLLLSRQHHGRHHHRDNQSYAFLNGMTDPLLDRVASAFFAGYKTTTDLHYAGYTGKGTANREG
jgi:hypothetical protein